jgi:hypothetical protein
MGWDHPCGETEDEMNRIRMSDLWVGVRGVAKRKASPADLLAAVRVAVEDGTIEGEVVGEKTIEWRDDYGGFAEDVLDYEPDRKRMRQYLVIPFSDGGSKT